MEIASEVCVYFSFQQKKVLLAFPGVIDIYSHSGASMWGLLEKTSRTFISYINKTQGHIPYRLYIHIMVALLTMIGDRINLDDN